MLSRARGQLQARAVIAAQSRAWQQWRIITQARSYSQGERSEDQGTLQRELIRKVDSSDHSRGPSQHSPKSTRKHKTAQVKEKGSKKGNATQQSERPKFADLGGLVHGILAPRAGKGHDQEVSHGSDALAKPRPPRGPIAPTVWRKEELEDYTSFGIVTTSRPHNTTIEELAQEIGPMPHIDIPAEKQKPALLVLLLTPGLARHVLDRNAPSTVYQRFQLQEIAGSQIESITAVVDQLPSSMNDSEGAEGMAYMLLRKPEPSEAGDQKLFSASAQKPGTLKFRVSCVERSDRFQEKNLQLPLAQTVFTTGMVSTLLRREYKTNPETNSLEFQKEEHLESKKLRFPHFEWTRTSTQMYSPLVPLTPFRKINYVMGNIIRKLSSDRSWSLAPGENPLESIIVHPHDTNQSMPASQELEEAVSKYFDALDLAPEPVSVWAFVVPRVEDLHRGRKDLLSKASKILMADSELISSSWDTNSECAKDMGRQVTYLLRNLLSDGQGGRLIKVLSGGGGWGKKAGLLSLDPDVEYSTRELRQDEGWNFNFDGVDDGTGAAAEAQKKQALGEIVKEGENIMFFLAPKQSHLAWGWEDESADRYTPPDGSISRLELAFGVVPSSIDAIPERSPSGSESTIIQHHPRCFGMLSEGGMALTSYKRSNHNISSQSKWDVPLSRFAFRTFVGSYFPDAHLSKFRNRSEKTTSSGATAKPTETPKGEAAEEETPSERLPESDDEKTEHPSSCEQDFNERIARSDYEEPEQSDTSHSQAEQANERKPL